MVYYGDVPYVVLLVPSARGLTLPGAGMGLRSSSLTRRASRTGASGWGAEPGHVRPGPVHGESHGLRLLQRPSNDVVRDALLLPSVNALTNVLGAAVVFSVAGFVADSLARIPRRHRPQRRRARVPDLLHGPRGDAVGRILAPFFFLMLLCLGLDSCFALVELVVSTFIDTRPRPSPTRASAPTGGWLADRGARALPPRPDLRLRGRRLPPQRR